MPSQSEQMTRRSLQKCLVANAEIKKGESFTEDNIVAKRTNGEGISAIYYDKIINRISDRNYKANDII